MKTDRAIDSFALLVLLASTLAFAQQADAPLAFTPAQTKVSYGLDASLHTVHGTFDLKSGSVHFNPATGEISGAIVIDATSGKSGNSGRDSKMHKDVLESAHYPEIVFRPDHVEGKVLPEGSSIIQVHGTFAIHGAEHPITLPVHVQMAPAQWTADTTFSVPYVEWGMKNPSNFFLHVKPSVEIEIHATGAK